jgi:hypothetical protein
MQEVSPHAEDYYLHVPQVAWPIHLPYHHDDAYQASQLPLG